MQLPVSPRQRGFHSMGLPVRPQSRNGVHGTACLFVPYAMFASQHQIGLDKKTRMD
jgi:hypothetical protein